MDALILIAQITALACLCIALPCAWARKPSRRKAPAVSCHAEALLSALSVAIHRIQTETTLMRQERERGSQCAVRQAAQAVRAEPLPGTQSKPRKTSRKHT